MTTLAAKPRYRPPGNKVTWLLIPALLVGTCFYLIPMVETVISSLSDSESHPTLGNFISIVGDSYYWLILWRTVRVSLFTTIAALVVSYPAALYLYFSTSRWRHLFLLVAISPLFVSVVIRSYGWIVLLSPNGALSALLPASLSINLLSTEAAIVIGLTHVYVPFMLLALNAALMKIDKRLLNAAASLGASDWRTFRDVIVPLSLPGIVAGSTIVFTISMTAFATPIMLGGTVAKTMPYLIYDKVMLTSDWRMGSALALFLMTATIVMVFALNRVLRRIARPAGQ